MLRVRTEVKPSKISGLGLFAAEFIAKGKVTWVFDGGIDMQISRATLDRLPSLERNFLVRYGFFSQDGNTLFYLADDLRFINHSFDPNIQSAPFEDRALRDIGVGEEMLCDYRGFEPDWFERSGLDPSAFR